MRGRKSSSHGQRSRDVQGQLQCSISRPGVLTPVRSETRLADLCVALLQVSVDAVSESARAVARSLLSLGGLGMRSSVRLRHPAHWASWADSVKMTNERHPEVSMTILRAVDERHASPSFMGVVSSVQTLEEAGFVPPSWEFQTSLTRMSPTSQETSGRQQQPALSKRISGGGAPCGRSPTGTPAC